MQISPINFKSYQNNKWNNFSCNNKEYKYLNVSRNMQFDSVNFSANREGAAQLSVITPEDSLMGIIEVLNSDGSIDIYNKDKELIGYHDKHSMKNMSVDFDNSNSQNLYSGWRKFSNGMGIVYFTIIKNNDLLVDFCIVNDKTGEKIRCSQQAYKNQKPNLPTEKDCVKNMQK